MKITIEKYKSIDWTGLNELLNREFNHDREIILATSCKNGILEFMPVFDSAKITARHVSYIQVGSFGLKKSSYNNLFIVVDGFFNSLSDGNTEQHFDMRYVMYDYSVGKWFVL